MKGDAHWLKEVQKGGRVLILDDESIWEVSPSHAGDTCTWDLVSGITVRDGADPTFPCRLFNIGTGERVDARYLGRRTQDIASAIPTVQRPVSSSTAEFPV